MKYSTLFGKTSKTEGTDLKIKSHRLLVQAGYIRESTAGRYYLLPLGLKAHNNIVKVVREHMDASGAQELVAPILHPLELWQETNRDSAAGFELMQVEDRRGAGFALGGTAEEMFVDLVRKFNISYKDLPFNIYQFGLKFRDELRARGGLLRVREFVMKDAYSFSTEDQFEAEYENMRRTYSDIFTALGLTAEVVAADGGYIGGDYSHEFIVDTEAGESTYFVAGDYSAHEDVAEFDKSVEQDDEEPAELTMVDADRGTTMEDGLKLHAPALMHKHIKNVVYINERQEIILACLRGDLDVNEVKLQNAVSCHHLDPLTDEQIVDWMDSKAGFISAVGLREKVNGHKFIIVADDSMESIVNGISGANLDKKDYVNINMGRDFEADILADIALAKAGYKTTDGQELAERRGIEVGNIFQLGYHYTDLMKDAEFTNDSGERQKYYMGCYGIGIGRTLAAIAEVLSDDNGLVWPANVAPYHVQLITLGNSDEVMNAAAKVQKALEDNSITVLHDDRDVRPGEKFADADLLGMPVRVVVSERSLGAGGLEVKARVGSEADIISSSDIVQKVRDILDQ